MAAAKTFWHDIALIGASWYSTAGQQGQREARTEFAPQHGAIEYADEKSLMINGAHVVIYTTNPEGDRAFFRSVLGFESVDAGHGWLIFALPRAESAFHPAEKNDRHELYLMCDDLHAEMAALRARGVECGDVVDARWGIVTKIRLPGGGTIGLYEPRHPRPLEAAPF